MPDVCWGLRTLHAYMYIFTCTMTPDPLCTCTGILCNDQCPDQLLLGQLTSDNWPLWSKIFITVLVVGLATVCMLIKMAFVAWVWWLERKQDAYLESLEGDEEETDAKLQVRTYV